MIGVTVNKDSDKVAKVVIINNKGEVLLLTRSKHHKKYAKELDLPGGHIKIGEKPDKGAIREVFEETGLKLSSVSFFKREQNKYFFFVKHNLKEGNLNKIILSEEHDDKKLYKIKDLNKKNMFEQIAIEVLESLQDDQTIN
tara:strand:+ start:2479 stop:2901 length:423 start_codon:yes stop_codon:yes gene_type:complete